MATTIGVAELFRMVPKPPVFHSSKPRHGVARIISKLGLGSRTQAAQWLREGRIRINGKLVTDPEFPFVQGRDCLSLDGHEPAAAARRALMLNKPRGLVTTASDEHGRDTVYACFEGTEMPWLAPVGRLDKASEGLLLFTNDPQWAARIASPTGPDKTYHVQINRQPTPFLLEELERGVECDGERLAAKSARCIRLGAKHAWLEIVLDEGRNRHIRRLLAARGVSVLRLVRVAVGTLLLGDLPKGRWRDLTPEEMALLSS